MNSVGMPAMLAARPWIGAAPLSRIATTNSAAAGPKKATRYHFGPTRTCRTWPKRRRTDPGPPTILVTTNGTSAKNTMLSSRNGSSGMSVLRIPKPWLPSSDGMKAAHPSP